MTTRNFLLQIQGLPAIRLNYVIEGPDSRWVQYIKIEGELSDAQQLQLQGLLPFTLSQLEAYAQADPLHYRISELESHPFAAFWDAYRGHNGSSKAAAADYWAKMSDKHKGLALRYLPAFVATKLQKGEFFPAAVVYLRQRRYEDFIKS